MTDKEIKEKVNSKYGKFNDHSFPEENLTIEKAIIASQEITSALNDDKIISIIKAKDLKSRVDLLSPSFLIDMGKVMQMGINKYFENSWKQMPVTADYAAAMRHLLMFRSGELRDTESDLSHLVHAAVQIMFLYEMTKNKKDGEELF